MKPPFHGMRVGVHTPQPIDGIQPVDAVGYLVMGPSNRFRDPMPYHLRGRDVAARSNRQADHLAIFPGDRIEVL